MKLLVVTPTLGESPWLAETVASVAAYAGPCEHVLVTPENAARAITERFPRVRVVAEPGGGMYAAINAGLDSLGDWTAFTYLNDDDVLLPDFSKNADAISAAGDRALIVYGGVRLIGARGRRLGAVPISPAPDLNRALYAQRLEPVYQHGTVATRAAVETADGPFDATLRFCGDSEFLARACCRGVPFLRATRREVAAFRLRAGQLTKDRAAMMNERALVDEMLGLLAPQSAGNLRWARMRFRFANLLIYAERMRRHGFLTFDQVLERAG